MRLLALCFVTSFVACGGAVHPVPEPLPPLGGPDFAARMRESNWPEGSALFGQHPRIAVPEDERPSRGAEVGLITIVAFSDFECPFCSRAAETVDDVLSRYPQIRFVFRQSPLPFHSHAMSAAVASLEAYAQRGDEGFWRMHDLLFRNQRALEREDLERYASQVGLDLPRFRAALDGSAHGDIIAKDQALAAYLGAEGTPTFFINGRAVVGAQPIEEFVTVINEELALAAEAMQDGVPAPEVAARIRESSPTALPDAEEETERPVELRGHEEPETYTVDIPRDAPSRGAPGAPIVIQEFTDMQCPFCSRVVPTLEQLLTEYSGRIRIVFRHYPLPFHEYARLAHQAAVEVREQGGDEKFWAYTNALFANQHALTRADLERHATELGGIRMPRFRRALDNATHDARVQADIDAVAAAGMRIGTPSFLINGRSLSGAQPIEAFRAAIDAALAARTNP